MSYTGGDASFYSHSSPYPSLDKYLNLDFQLGALEQRAISGLIKGEDTIDVALYLGQSYGRNPTKAGNPSLPYPLWNLRISAPEFQPPAEVSAKAYEGLLELLPKETKARLLEELGRPFAERSQAFVALEGLLQTAAKFIVMLETANKEIDPASPAAANRGTHLNSPADAAVNLDAIAKDVLKLAKALLKEFPGGG